MKTESKTNHDRAPQTDNRKATARLIATFAGSRILRHHDGSLDVCSTSPTERTAALAWICGVSPNLALRVRPGSEPTH